MKNKKILFFIIFTKNFKFMSVVCRIHMSSLNEIKIIFSKDIDYSYKLKSNKKKICHMIFLSIKNNV